MGADKATLEKVVAILGDLTNALINVGEGLGERFGAALSEVAGNLDELDRRLSELERRVGQ